MNLFMQKLAELENQYNIDKQALLEARLEIQKVEAFTKNHGGAAVVCVCYGKCNVFVSATAELSSMAVENGKLLKEQIAGRWVYEVEGIKVLEC